VTTASIRDRIAGELDAMLEETAALVAIDSGSYDPAGVNEVSAAMVAPLEALGFAVERMPLADRGDRVAATLRLGDGPEVVVVGHADTVWPAGTTAGWRFERDGAFASGPGAGDMKGCVVMAVHAIAAALDAGLEGIGTLTVLIVPDEELGSPGSRGWIEAHVRGAGACLGLEAGWPGDGVVVARGAVGALRVDARGRTAPVADDDARERGASAVAALAPLVAEIEALGGDAGALSVGIFRGGTARQVVPGEAELHVDLRARDQAAADALVAALRSLVADRRDHPRVSLRVEGGVTRPAFPPERSDGLLALARRRAAELGGVLTGHRTRGGSDASFAAALGVPTLDGLGPICHDSCARTERIEVASLASRGALLAGLLLDLAAGRRGE
jgi:glutamate carboxypeptidase